MTPEDFRALEDWLYAAGDRLGTLPDDARIDARGLRRMRAGRQVIPPTLAAYLIGRAALRLTLKGWREDLPPVSAGILAEILNRREEALRHAESVDQDPPR